MGTNRRFTPAAVIVFLLLGSTGAVGLPIKAEMTGQFTGGLYGLYLSADPSVVWKPGRLAVGVGTELIVGLSQFDMYVFPYLRAEVGLAHVDFGYVLALVRPPAGDGPAGLSAGFGIAPKPFDVGYGRLGFDLGLDFSITAYADAYSGLSGASAAERILASAVVSGRFGLGVTYSFALL